MEAVVIRSDWVGRLIEDKFTLLLWLGESGDGGVFLTDLDGPGSKKAAIKLVPAGDDAEARLSAWKAATALSHPSLTRVFQAGHCQAASAIYVVTEYAEEVLAHIIPERPLTPDEAREMLEPVLEALSYLHGKGLIHGHLKPSNILVIDNQLKISSDGVRRAGDSLKPEALSIYDGPETAKTPLNPAADLWSLGVTLVEALNQHPPLWERSSTNDPVVPNSIPQPFRDIAQGTLRVDPACRLSVSEIKSLLDPASSIQPAPAAVVSAPIVAEPLPKPVPEAPVNEIPTAQIQTAKRINFRTLAALAAVLVVIVAIGALVMRSHNEPSPVASQTQQDAAPSAAVSPQGSAPADTASSNLAVNSPVDADVAERVMPDVPTNAQRTIHGTIKIRVHVSVDPSGTVTNARIVSSGGSRYFAERALKAAERWKFKPTQANGQPVAGAWVLHFEFRRSGTEVSPVPSDR
jgi:TonB family protein